MRDHDIYHNDAHEQLRRMRFETLPPLRDLELEYANGKSRFIKGRGWHFDENHGLWRDPRFSFSPQLYPRDAAHALELQRNG